MATWPTTAGREPVEGLSLQRSLLAFMRYGHHAETGMIGRKFIDMLAKTDRYTQQYNPFTAQATAGGDGYGPTILAALEYMAYLYGVGFEEDKVVFSALDDARKTEYTQTIYGRAYAVRRENGRAAVYVDGKRRFRSRRVRAFTLRGTACRKGSSA